MTSTTYRTNSEVLTATIDLSGIKVVDVGCGEGDLVRLMTRHGAKVVGVECNPQQLEKAHGEKPVGDEVYCEGKAESLPFDDGSIDTVVFFNSLHHVAEDAMATALKEAARVLKTGGLVYVCEPLAEGPHFQVMQPVHDETQVRAKAYEAVHNAPAHNLTQTQEFTYIHPATYGDFAQFKERILRINPQRSDDFTALEPDLMAAFETLGKPTDKGFVFDQPMRVNLFVKS